MDDGGALSLGILSPAAPPAALSADFTSSIKINQSNCSRVGCRSMAAGSGNKSGATSCVLKRERCLLWREGGEQQWFANTAALCQVGGPLVLELSSKKQTRRPKGRGCRTHAAATESQFRFHLRVPYIPWRSRCRRPLRLCTAMPPSFFTCQLFKLVAALPASTSDGFSS